MKKIVVLIVLMVVFSSLVSAFSFADTFSGNALNFVTGKTVVNKAPKSVLNMPSDNQVVSGKIVKFDWSYNDYEGDEQANYILQIDDDYKFYSPFTYYGLTETVREVHIPTGDGQYYWRVQSKDIYDWGAWSRSKIFYLDESEKICSDDTLFWQCSDEKPFYCSGGRLIEDCQRCGCSANEICSSSGICVTQTCSDGTLYGDCSNNLPKYCRNGDLLVSCNFCGCPDGQECTSSGQCVKTVVKIVPIEEKVSLLSKIADFFKNLLGF